MSAHQTYRRASFAGGMLVACLLAFGSTYASAIGQAGDVDLSPTPPDLTASVDPNIVVTFDDSGSMDSNFMGDFRPFDTGSWSGPWFCAGSIDPRITDPTNIKSHAMNGTYYNPLALVTYTPPVKEDNTPFPNAPAALTAVWADGIAVNRPTGPVTPAGATFLNNPTGPGTATAGDTRVDNLMGVKTVTNHSLTGRNVQCAAGFDPGSCVCAPAVGNPARVCSWTTTVDQRWQCGYSTSPMDGVTANPDGGTYPNGGPYYYRLKSTVVIPIDAFGNPTAAGRTALYTVANWQAIPVPVAEYQNVANWFAYYRTRNLLTRTALSRVFGQFGDNIRAAWQNINNGTYLLPATTIITNLNDTNAAAPNYRKSFFDWVFQVGASGTTPDRKAVIRAGNFFTRGNTSNLKDPYWEPGQGAQPGQELACRQNFNMLVTDGYWNEVNPSPLPAGFFGVQNPPSTLPDNTAFSRSDATSRVFWDVPSSPTGSCANDGSTDCYPSMADIAFFFWAKDLRTDLANIVPPYVPDLTTGITGTVSLPVGGDPLQNMEIYNNPANDPASWQHMVQFMVTLGIAGNLQFSDDVDCTNPQNDLCKLREGQANSAGITGWPQPSRNAPPAIDDTWHAAINSRGSYFSASNPTALVQHLTDIINNILSRRGSSTALSATMSTLTSGTQGYSAGYDTSDYSGFLIKQDLDPITGAPGATDWDASCTLTGGTFSGGVCTLPTPLPDASVGRNIITANDAGSASVTFTSFSSLSSAEQNALNQDPTSTTKCASPTGNTNGCDGNGQIRANWLRGVRTNESIAPLMRHRSSVLGAIINSQPRYVSAPTGGFTDNFPPGSPEALAAAPNSNGVPGAGSYSQFVNTNTNRAPTVYVGANDGMLHAFDGVTGRERWAYMPMTLFGIDNVSGETDATVIGRRRLAQETNTATYKSAPTVDNTAVVQDVFMSGAWHTVLVGSLRYGGRGVYALDITNPATPTFLWEHNYTQSGFQHLGYTYAYPNVSRISYNGGTWVVLLSSGYFPLPDQTPPDPVANDASANQTSLFVINLQSGALIREIQTTATAPVSYALSTAAAYDLNSDQVDDIAVAGDLAGNLWRFDLSSTASTSWTVDLMFKSYSSAGEIGRHPISVMPVGMRDPQAQAPMWVFGTGKFLGLCDRTASSPPSNCGPDANTALQQFYGIRDYGTASTNYPILPNQLNSWIIAEDSTTLIRTLSGPTVVTNNKGWTIPLDSNLTGEFGERDVVSIVPFYSANYAILTTLIPKGNDPCSPDRRGAIMAVDGATGGPLVASPLGGGGPSGSSTNNVIGQVVDSKAIPIAGIPAVVGSQGGPLLLPGLPQFSIPAPPPHRGAWRELLDLL